MANYLSFSLFVAIAIEAANKLGNRDQLDEEDEHITTTHNDVNDVTDDEENVGYFDGDKNDSVENGGEQVSFQFELEAIHYLIIGFE